MTRKDIPVVGERIVPENAVREMFSCLVTGDRTNPVHAAASAGEMAHVSNDLHRKGLLPGLNLIGADTSGHVLLADNNRGADHKVYQVDTAGKVSAVYGVESKGGKKVLVKQKDKDEVGGKDRYSYHQNDNPKDKTVAPIPAVESNRENTPEEPQTPWRNEGHEPGPDSGPDPGPGVSRQDAVNRYRDFNRKGDSWINRDFHKIDSDGDGFLNLYEINGAVSREWRRQSPSSSAKIMYLQDLAVRHDLICQLSNDEYGPENSGITRWDLRTYQSRRLGAPPSSRP